MLCLSYVLGILQDVILDFLNVQDFIVLAASSREKYHKSFTHENAKRFVYLPKESKVLKAAAQRRWAAAQSYWKEILIWRRAQIFTRFPTNDLGPLFFYDVLDDGDQVLFSSEMRLIRSSFVKEFRDEDGILEPLDLQMHSLVSPWLAMDQALRDSIAKIQITSSSLQNTAKPQMLYTVALHQSHSFQLEQDVGRSCNAGTPAGTVTSAFRMSGIDSPHPHAQFAEFVCKMYVLPRMVHTATAIDGCMRMQALLHIPSTLWPSCGQSESESKNAL